MQPPIERAPADDFENVCRILHDHHLPLEGLRDHLATTLVVRQNGQILGSAALEVYPDGALLRSVAVAPAVQGRGLGHHLTAAAIRLAEGGTPALYLLTTTAAAYFQKCGCERIQRSDVPDAVQGAVEFTSACPLRATVMRRSL